MLSEKMVQLGKVRSAIRDLYEHGLMQSALVGPENVFDFSLGNPSVPPPDAVGDAFMEALSEMPSIEVHGYTTASGCMKARDAIARVLNARYDMHLTRDNLYLTCGAAAALTAAFKALTLSEHTEFIAIAPFFPEYRCFAETAGAHLTVVQADEAHFQIDFDALSSAINEHTQGVIINSPNNPSGACYSRETLLRLSALLSERSKATKHPIYLISDEPYRELYYETEPLPFPAALYRDTIVCYSYSKSLSIPGERIGYVLVPTEAADFHNLMPALAGAARSMGYVCAPSVLQRVVARCAGVLPDLATYRANRDLLYASLSGMGYDCVHPSGAFYLFVRAPGGDGDAFSMRAKAENVLVVSGRSFGCPSFIRISYCVDRAMIERALPRFQSLIDGSRA